MKKFMYVLLLVFPIITVLMMGCASIVSKSEYPVNINSQPQGAQISIEDRQGTTVFKGITPAVVTLSTKAGYFKGENYTVSFKKEGYDIYTTQIKRGVDGWYWAGNLFFGGLVGWFIVDPLTGAMWTLKDVNVYLNLQPSSAKINIVTVDNVPDHLRSKMVRIK